MVTVKLIIDNLEVSSTENTTLLQAAYSAGIYIPAVCYHPDLPVAIGTKPVEAIYRGGEKVENSQAIEFEGCKLCLVEIESSEEPVLACNTFVADGLVVNTNSKKLQELRKANLVAILTNHPHACLLCAQKEGCTLEPCTLNVPKNERCCTKFGRCELQKIVEYIGIREDTPKYIFKDYPIVENEPLFTRNYNLCIGCTRCIRICKDVRGVEALGFVYKSKQELLVGTREKSLRDSKCRFCGACIEVCPTGALLDKELKLVEREKELLPCVYKCPLGVDIPTIMRLITERKFAEAISVLQKSNIILNKVLARVCHHPCESSCRRSSLDKPLGIRAVKRFLLSKSYSKIENSLKTTKRIAVIGAGPSGLAAAYYLANLGHKVVIFEASSRAGGTMLTGIPEYRLPIKLLEEEVATILAHPNIEFKPNLTIKSAELKELGREYNSVFIATGAQVSKKLPIEGIELQNVFFGLEFLKTAKTERKPKLEGRVVVIGGGNVAVDAALTAYRLGATEVRVITLEKPEELPAFSWEVEEALEEGIIFEHSWGVKKLISNYGKVKRIELTRCTTVFDKEGNFKPSFDESITKTIETDNVIVAIGQTPAAIFKEYLNYTKVGTLEVNPITLETKIKGIFAGGEVVVGASSVVEAIEMGKRAANSIDRYLGGKGLAESSQSKDKPSSWLGKDENFLTRAPVTIPTIPLEQRLKTFAEIELELNEELAVEEAKRCLRCELRFAISPVQLPPEKWLEFSLENINKVPHREGVYQLLDEKKTIIYIKGTADLRAELEEQLQSNKKARYFTYEEEPMYTKRESELLQQYFQRYGRMPEGNEALLEDLF